jgi:hypothetical protein
VAATGIRYETNRITEALWQKVDQVVMVAVVMVRAAKAVAVAAAPGAARVRAVIEPLASE